MSRDLIGDMLRKDKENEGDLPLKGKGKPLSREILEGDALDRTVKNAGFLPEWIRLQQKIRDRLILTNNEKWNGLALDKLENEVASINDLIKKYNKICPTKMQKMLLDPTRLESQLRNWE
ncbi:DUF1992 domain-containing protein [Evansella sp. AB-P1]|uniref:DnaJ family domain-containing protein n=1 Tax=Evansella sp. AB-P1 TaxID=3037653 RepID=UPI00241FD603|nr:DnaJ family domain-containing protein [Evansella sp. AB-P1]MDG5788325.1 DUF1992 domain-containing protein [Evansella sp. AB-P1]